MGHILINPSLPILNTIAAPQLYNPGTPMPMPAALPPWLPLLLSLLCLLCLPGSPALTLHRSTLSTPWSSFTLPEPRPQLAYLISSLHLRQPSLNLEHSLTHTPTSTLLQFHIITRAPWVAGDWVDVVIMTNDHGYMQCNTVAVDQLTTAVKYQQEHKYNSQHSYHLQVYPLTLPMKYTIDACDSTGFAITFTIDPHTPIYFTYVLVEKLFIDNNVYVDFQRLSLGALHFVLWLRRDGVVSMAESSTWLGVRQLVWAGGWVGLVRVAIYEEFVWGGEGVFGRVGYADTQAQLQLLEASFVMVRGDYRGCPGGSFLTYLLPFATVPDLCLPCHPHCRTCTSLPLQFNSTGSSSCTTCPLTRYLVPLEDAAYGSCECNRGLPVSETGQCLSCEFHCLGWRVEFMRSVTEAVFMLIFTESALEMSVDFGDNLQVEIEGVIVDYNYSADSNGSYKISLPVTSMQACESTCTATFTFLTPDAITHGTRFLTTQQHNLTLQQFYIVADTLPEQLTQAFRLLAILITASSSSGQTSFIKMLFQLQQVIEVHKYVNVEVPVVFKQFVQILGSFRFMDVTTVISFDVVGWLRGRSGGELDIRGPAKSVYYESGANYYKNMVAVWVSTLVMVLINCLIFTCFRAVPLQFCQKMAQKLQIRWVITLSQLVQTMVLPCSLYATIQLSYIVLTAGYTWVYALCLAFSLCVLLFPLLPLAYAHSLVQRGNVVDTQLAEDLLLDCRCVSNMTYIFYYYGYVKKFMFGICLGLQLPGWYQLCILLTLNIVHMLMIVYILVQRLYTSRVKILTRTITLLCLMMVEVLILAYNAQYHGLESMVLIGVSCTYLTIVVTVIGIVELVIKVVEIGRQRVTQARGIDMEFVRQGEHVLKCYVRNGGLLVIGEGNEEGRDGKGGKEGKSENGEIVEIEDRGRSTGFWAAETSLQPVKELYARKKPRGRAHVDKEAADKDQQAEVQLQQIMGRLGSIATRAQQNPPLLLVPRSQSMVELSSSMSQIVQIQY